MNFYYMDSETKSIARALFQREVYRSEAQRYEDLLLNVMQFHNPSIKKVTPQGQLGDRKNDGYDKEEGVYYQVYAPRDIRKKVSYAVSKLNKDFEGLYEYWNEIAPIKEFNFAYNDRYNGVFPSIEKDLNKIKNEYDLNVCDSFLSSNLEDIFLNLEEDEIIDIIGFIPDPKKIDNLDYSILNEVINFIIENDSFDNVDLNKDVPDFSKKIQFNNLSNSISSLLGSASLQVGVLEEYFEANSNFVRDKLSERVKSQYLESQKELGDDQKSNNDVVFMDIWENITPKPIYRNTSIVIMSYFFETCDIFEEPH